MYHNTLHFCEFCNTSGTLQRLPSGSVTDPIPYRDYPYPSEPILANLITCTTRPPLYLAQVSRTIGHRPDKKVAQPQAKVCMYSTPSVTRTVHAPYAPAVLPYRPCSRALLLAQQCASDDTADSSPTQQPFRCRLFLNRVSG